MNRPSPITAKQAKLNTGYRHTRLNLKDFQPTSHWVVIKEGLDRNVEGIIVPDAKTATMGTVMALSQDAKDLGIRIGDSVVYEQWQGGRWAFTNEIWHSDSIELEELEVLIMSLDSVWCIVREEHGT